MNIQPISAVFFGLNAKHQTIHTSPVSKRTISVVSLKNGKTIVYSTNYLHNKVTDKLVKVFNKFGDYVKSKYVTFGDNVINIVHSEK